MAKVFPEIMALGSINNIFKNGLKSSGAKIIKHRGAPEDETDALDAEGDSVMRGEKRGMNSDGDPADAK